MFTRIGKKIKTVATVLFYIMAVSSVIGAFYVIFNFGKLFGVGNAILLGVLIALVGCLLAWLSSITLYGYGELVDNSTIIKEMLAGSASADQVEKRTSPFNGLAKAVGGARAARPAQPAQPQQNQSTYQQPQTLPLYNQNRQPAAYTRQPNPYQRAGSYPPSQHQASSLTGKSGWTQVDTQNVQCPNCRYTLSAEQARRYGCCPQCRMPFNP